MVHDPVVLIGQLGNFLCLLLHLDAELGFLLQEFVRSVGLAKCYLAVDAVKTINLTVAVCETVRL